MAKRSISRIVLGTAPLYVHPSAISVVIAVCLVVLSGLPEWLGKLCSAGEDLLTLLERWRDFRAGNTKAPHETGADPQPLPDP